MNSKIKFTIVAVLVFTLLAACQPIAGVPMNNMYNPNVTPQINVTGTGKVYIVPDLANVYIGVRSEADEVASALSSNNDKAKSIAAALTASGIAQEDIQTTSFNVYPMQNYNPDGTVSETKYVVENTVFVKVRELNNLGKILDSVVSAGANTINGISFDVSDRVQAEADARKAAVADARARAEELATLAGVQLGRLMNISIYNSGGVQPMYDAKGGGMGMASSAVPVAAGQMLIQVDANVSYEIVTK